MALSVHALLIIFSLASTICLLAVVFALTKVGGNGKQRLFVVRILILVTGILAIVTLYPILDALIAHLP